MKDKKVNTLVERLFGAMFVYWFKHRNNAGFEYKYEQELYNAVCAYKDKEKTRLK